MKNKDLQIQELKNQLAVKEQKLKQVESQMVHKYAYTCQQLKHFGRDSCTGSAVIIELQTLGSQKIAPVALIDGLSDELIEALKVDLKRSFDLATEIKP